MSGLWKSMWERAVPAILLALISSITFAQNIQLSAEQQRMLDQLPPAQRQQAMDALRQMQSQQSQQSGSGQQSINEVAGGLAELKATATQLPAVVDLTPRAEGRSRIILRFEADEDLTPATGIAVVLSDTRPTATACPTQLVQHWYNPPVIFGISRYATWK